RPCLAAWPSRSGTWCWQSRIPRTRRHTFRCWSVLATYCASASRIGISTVSSRAHASTSPARFLRWMSGDRLFGDWLRSPEACRRYEATKRELATKTWKYAQNYADARTTVVWTPGKYDPDGHLNERGQRDLSEGCVPEPGDGAGESAGSKSTALLGLARAVAQLSSGERS